MSRPPCCDRDVWSLPLLDTAAIADNARQGVEVELAAHEPDAAEVAKAAATLLDDINARLAAAREARDLAAWTVWKDWHVRHGANIPGAIGVQRVAWKKIRDRLDAENPPHAEDALRRLPALAAAWAELAAAADAARQVRYSAEDRLLADGWNNAQVAQLIGRDPSRVSRRTSEADPAA